MKINLLFGGLMLRNITYIKLLERMEIKSIMR
jgi:hypothetical protein